MIPHDTIKINEYRNHSKQRSMISSEVISELILNFDILSALFCCFSSQSEAILIFIMIQSHYNASVTIYGEPTHITMVICVKNFQTEFTVEIYSKSIVTAIGKVLLMEFS